MSRRVVLLERGEDPGRPLEMGKDSLGRTILIARAESEVVQEQRRVGARVALSELLGEVEASALRARQNGASKDVVESMERFAGHIRLNREAVKG